MMKELAVLRISVVACLLLASCVVAEPARKSVPSKCFAAKGSWCGPYYRQRPQQAPMPPVHSRTCPRNCSGLGACNRITGACDCPAGAGGADCSQPDKRPCAMRLGGMRLGNHTTPDSSIGEDMRDRDPTREGFTYSRCHGICDDDIAACYCDTPKYGRIPPPRGSPPGTPPVRVGRPQLHPCSMLTADARGRRLPDGRTPYEDIHNATHGWCNADEGTTPRRHCGCLDGTGGELCDKPLEAFCPNQCAGHGDCVLGFCRCRGGWWGADCAHRVEAAEAEATPSRVSEAQWLAAFAVDPWARQAELAAGGARAAAPGGGGGRLRRLLQLPIRLLRRLLGGVGAAEGEAYGGVDGGAGQGEVPRRRAGGGGAGEGGRRRGGAGGGKRRRRGDGGGRGGGGSGVGGGEGGGRLRPLIYVYDMPGIFVSKMLQYRTLASSCTWRRFSLFNVSIDSGNMYSAESYLHEMMLQSPHRTLDPEEADFFYVPVYLTCFIHPVSGFADKPWFYVDSWSRVKGAAVMALEALNHVKTAYPYWNRTPETHIWFFAHDEGACWAPKEMYDRSIMLSHWGRLDPWPHVSGSSYWQDNYSRDVVNDPLLPEGFLAFTSGHPCYRPDKDLVLPLFRPPPFYRSSPHLGFAQPQRDWLAFHRGRGMGNSVGTEPPSYSRGVRQALYNLSRDNDWRGKYAIHFGDGQEVPGEYSELLSRSRFCLVAAGDGWSARFDDALLHGCIPVVVMDNVDGPFGSLFKWETFSVRVAQADLARLPDILTSIPPRQVESFQRNISRVWHKMAWLDHPDIRRQLQRLRAHAASVAERDPGVSASRAPWMRPLSDAQVGDDAMHTLVQWLYFKLRQRRSPGAGAGAAAVAPRGGDGR